MKNILYIILVLGTILNAQKSTFQYVSPKPASQMVSNETNLIFRYSEGINRSTISNNLIKVEGSKSGVHAGELILSDDEKTIVFNPVNAFSNNEEVNVVLHKGIKTKVGFKIPKFSFSFTTAPAEILQLHDATFSESFPSLDIQSLTKFGGNDITSSLPAPPITIDSINNPSPGYIFMATWDRNVPHLYGNFIFILDSSGNIVDSVRVNGAPFDFQVQPNGLLSYAHGDFALHVPLPGEQLQHMVLDQSLAVVDSFKMKNGYSTDFHEFIMLPNGHAMLMSYHTITYDMSKIVEGGKTDASLVINIIQEQDLDKNVVFEWRNIDYIPITDSDLDLTASRINYGTINAFDMDDDGNILISFRNHSEIMKISRATGELMWRMGGPRGEFTFVGEHEENAPYYFARQHNIRRLSNGNVSLFDNGEFHNPPYSRAAEYSLDEINKVATLVSEWRYPNGNIFCVTAGNAERLPNDGWFIGYGVPNPQFVKRNAVEVHPDGSIALELSLPNKVLAYRTSKFPWNELVSRPSFSHFEILEGNIYSFNNEEIVTGIEIKFNSLNAASYNEATITRIPYGPIQPEFFGNIPDIYPVSIRYNGAAITSHSSEFHFDLTSFPEIKNPSKTSIYYREFPDKGLFLMKPTTYDSLNNKLIATVTGFGEIVFGSTENDVISNSPIPFEPLDSIKVLPLDSLLVRWSGKGSFDSFNVQISTDSNFNTTLIDSNLNSSFIVMKDLINHTKYFWRVKSILGASESSWSSVWNFETTDPYISITSPDGGEEWQQGSNAIVRWETNISDSVDLSLLTDEGILISIGKALGNLNAFEWEITSEFNTGISYQIKIKSMSDTTLFDLSNQSFSIIDSITNIDKDLGTIPNEFVLLQNYPNPFNPTTKIKYSVPKEVANRDLLLQLKVYDILGKVVVTLVNERGRSGNYEVTFDASNLTSGVYYSQLTAGDFIDTKKMLLLK